MEAEKILRLVHFEDENTRDGGGDGEWLAGPFQRTAIGVRIHQLRTGISSQWH